VYLRNQAKMPRAVFAYARPPIANAFQRYEELLRHQRVLINTLLPHVKLRA
jgi:hypothetical protein